jgi:2,4-dienoyl-CoA reductase-like NADH-dependent reductase (Old Yellow Enzyme family)/thioredoxin reductase
MTSPDSTAASAVGIGAFPTLLSPIQVGTMALRNRVMLPPHASAIGNLWGTEEEAARNIAYYESRVRGGACWIDSLSGHLANTFAPGFEPTGIGAATTGYFRLPFFVERVREFSDRIHPLGGFGTVQIVHQGGMPHGPSSLLSAPVINLVPHVLSREEIAWFVREYAFCASQAQAAGLDGVELHANHDDLLEWFLSQLTNQRDDEYGGSMENRARLVVEILTAIRDVFGRTMTLGLRLNMREEVPGGYDVQGGIEIAKHLESTGLLDYVHVVVGSPWGNPSYIQPHFFDPAQWAPLAGEFTKALSIPVVHTGRINSPEVAEKVLAAGFADVVGMARAHIADGDLLLKAREGRPQDIRPCVGGNECISRRYVEGLPFGCAVNPHTSNEIDGPWPSAVSRRRLLVVGGGPAGMELAALARESGHDVTLWEAADELGGQLRIATKAPGYRDFARYLDWQRRRLADSGVDVVLGHRATPDSVRAAGADTLALATGATPRRPPIPGADLGWVHDIRDVLTGAAVVGRRVLVVAQDDHMPPLSVADHLASQGHQVTVVYATPAPATLLSRYILGGIMGRLDLQGVRIRVMEEVSAISAGAVTVRNVYSWRESEIGDIDSVVLACGGVSDTRLFDDLKSELPDVHLLGDAYAPRRLVFATRQAYALAQLLAKS